MAAPSPATALQRCVGDVTAFADEYWGRRPMYRRAAGDFTDLLDVASVEALLTDLGRRPTFRVVREGATIPASAYTAPERLAGRTIDDVADVDRILDLVAGGATVVLQGLQRTWPPLIAFCLELEREISHPVQANAYLSPPATAGLRRHADEHDVLVLQIAGAKCWDVEGLGALTVSPGDVLYVPAGTRHDARTSEQMSLHLTLGVLATTYRQVLHRMIDELTADRLDRPLPIGYVAAGPTPLAAELASLQAAAARSLATVDPGGVAGRVIARRRQRGARRWTGRLRVTVDPSALDAGTEVRAREPIELATDGDHVVIVCADRRLRLPATTRPALEALAGGATRRVGELPGLDDDDRRVLVRRLVREGVVEIRPPATHP